MNKSLAIIGTNGLPAKYGGFETLTNYLVENLAKDFDITVYCSKTNKEEQLSSFKGATLKYFNLSANGIESIFYDIFSIFHAWYNYDILLILGSSGGIILPLNKLFNKKVVLNFGGLDWKREKWNVLAKKFLKISEAIAVKYSNTVVVVDNAVFQDYVKEEYDKKSFLIEYGGDHVIKIQEKELLKKHGLENCEYFLSVSRAQEDNNIHLLLEGFKDITNKLLVVISNWQISEYGKKLKEEYKKNKNIVLIDAIYDQKELDSIRSNAYCYIHTHSACGSAPSLIEAMNLGLPIVAYDVPANHATTEDKALFFRDSAELQSCLRNLGQEKLEELRKSSLEISSKRYKWSIISNKYKELFL